MEIFSDFWGLTKEETEELLRIGAVSIREFEKRQMMVGMDGETDEIGIMLSGVALLESANLDEQRRILDYYETGAVFGRGVIPNPERGLYYVISRTSCRAAFLNEKKLLAENMETKLRQEILFDGMAAAHKRALMHTDILGQRFLRQKLLSYFWYLSRKKGKNSFELPLSLTDCADYLAVDRTAMMRELKKMKEEGIVRTQGRRISLLRATWADEALP